MKKITQIFLFFFIPVSLLFSQGPSEMVDVKSRTIKIEAGQKLDMLTAILKPGAAEKRNVYFSKVFPLANQHGFKLDISFIPIGVPVRGNYQPDFISFMSWPSHENHKAFKKEVKQMKDYSMTEARRDIWSVFNLTHYNNLEENLEFTVYEDKIYVFTAYWIEDMDQFIKAKQRGKKVMERFKGKLVSLLGQSTSPDGYFYQPDMVSVTEWDSVEVFQEFLKHRDNENGDAGSINVNQWMTRANFGN